MRIFISFIVFFSLFSPLSAGAAVDFVKTPHVEVRMIPEENSVQPGRAFGVAFHFKIKKGWHTYWLNPGDSGEAPRLKWETSSDFTGGPLEFPDPSRIEIPPLANFGYSGEVIYLAEVKPAADLKDVSFALKADLNWLVCEEFCIPEKGHFEISLPLSPSPPTADEERRLLFEEARKKIPDPARGSRAFLRMEGNEVLLEVEDDSPLPPGPLAGAAFFPAAGGVIENAAAQDIRKTPAGIVIRVRKSEILRSTPETLRGLLVLDGAFPEGRRAEWVFASTKEEKSAPFKVLGFAFLGGLLLNLMPCVFPVLSIKVLSLIKKSGEARAKIMKHGLSYTLGVLVSFWILAGILLLLKLGGEAVGWGFQLQSPVFLLVLSYLLFFMALSLLGLFEIGNSVMGLGHALAGRGGYTGSFFTGALATVVATPCVAPFMGPALALGLSQPSAVSFLIFSALGLGLALPYLALCLHPAWLKFLPKPGAWMETFKQAMAFPLFATVIWILWVFLLQTSPLSLTWVLIGLLVLGFGSWLSAKLKIGAWKKSAAFLGVLLALALGLSGLKKEPKSAVLSSAQAGVEWLPYSPEALENLRKEGKPVFLDFTAAWCITCQVNERVALRSDEVLRRFQEKGVSLIKADWTHPNEAIARALKDFGREGVPLYILYGKGAEAAPQILPQILTPKAVLEALDKI